MTDFTGTTGNDTWFGTAANETANGGAGDDYLIARAGDDIVNGEDGDDRIVGEEGNDHLSGGAGVDDIEGREGDDWIDGGDGNDRLYGDSLVSGISGNGNDQISGGLGNDNIWGGGGNDAINGDDGNDFIKGGHGEDTIDGGAGDDFLDGYGEYGYGTDGHVDTILGGSGNDFITVGYGDSADGGADSDTIYLNFYAGASAGIIADFRQLQSNGTMVIGGGTLTNIESVGGISGTQFDDVIVAGAVAGVEGITLDGWGGNDDLTGSSGVDSIYGGDGDDIIRGGVGLNTSISPSTDRLRGDAGNDTIYIGDDGALASGDDGDDTVYGGSASDSINGGNGADHLYGAGGDDGISGDGGDDIIDGGDGNDWLNGYGDNDTITGGAGDDHITGGSGSDALIGGEGNDHLDGGEGIDIMWGGLGDDTYVVDEANPLGSLPYVRENPDEGIDTIESFISYQLFTAAGESLNVENLTLRGWSNIDGWGDYQNNIIRGNDGNNDLYGLAGDDILDGWWGDDLFVGGAGNDQLWGGQGFDIASYEDAAAGVIVNLATGTAQSTGGSDAAGIGTDSLFGIEIAWGSAFADILTAGNSPSSRLIGGGGDDTLLGGLAADELIGGDGNDVITGGFGKDRLAGDNGSGNSGADIFRDTMAGLDGDTILDFSVGDKIILTDAPLASFSFNLSGNVLEYLGGSLTFQGGVQGTITVRAAAGGGVELTLVESREVRNDFNGDGRSDLIWRNDNGSFTSWLGQENGGFVSNDANAWAVLPTSWQVAGTGDFNGDGHADLLWRRDDGAFTNWMGQDGGGFASNDANAWAILPTSWHVAGTGDFNGDGKHDVLWRRDDGAFTEWLGQENGGFVSNDAHAWAILPNAWQIAGTGDFNGDGKHDVIWRRDDGAFTEWLGQENGGFVSNDAHAWTLLPTEWQVAGTGDFNGDGKDDVIWRRSDGAFTEWLGQDNGGFVSNDTHAWALVPTSWHVADVGDFDGDGNDDIAWRNDNGAFTVWLGQENGGFVSNDAHAWTVLPNSWHVQGPDAFWP